MRGGDPAAALRADAGADQRSTQLKQNTKAEGVKMAEFNFFLSMEDTDRVFAIKKCRVITI